MLGKTLHLALVNFTRIGDGENMVDEKKLMSLQGPNSFEDRILKDHYRGAYIRDTRRMLCVLFEKHGTSAGKGHVKALTKLFLHMYQEINNAFGPRNR